VLVWLNATLTEKVLSTIYGLTTTIQAWAHLANRFTPNSRSTISHLKCQHQIVCQGSKKCYDYLLTTKGYANQLAAIGKGVDDEDLISFMVRGLNPSYHPFITTLIFANKDSSISFDDFQKELLNYEQLLDA
jgi:hypothetical protein